MLRNSGIFISLFSFLLISCGEEALPKPKAHLRLEYPVGAADSLQLDCPYTFVYNQMAQLKLQEACALDLEYPNMNAAIFITYKPVSGNLRELLTDAQKLAYEHVVKADNILEQPFVNVQDRVFGMLYEVQGNAASQAQFYATDSTDHFLTGSLYFYARPNYDSIYPAAVYLQNDIRRIMESLKWR